MTNDQMQDLLDAMYEASPDNDPSRVADRKFYRLARENLHQLVNFARSGFAWNVMLREAVKDLLLLMPRERLQNLTFEEKLRYDRILRVNEQGEAKQLFAAIELCLSKGCNDTCSNQLNNSNDCDCGHEALADAMAELRRR